MDIVLLGDGGWFLDGAISVSIDPIVRANPDDSRETWFNLGVIRDWFDAQVLKPSSNAPAVVFDGGRISASMATLPDTGSLARFAVWGGTAVDDPYNTYALGVTGLSSGSSGNAWTRHSAVVAPPTTARYLAVGGKFMGMPGTGAGGPRRQHIKKVQVEVAPVGANTPSAFGEAREVRTTVRADRANLAFNPRALSGGYVGEYLPRWAWTVAFATGGTTPVPGLTTYARITSPGTTDTGGSRGIDIYWNPDVAPGTTGDAIKRSVTPGQPVTLSGWARSSVVATSLQARIAFHNGAGAPVGPTVNGPVIVTQTAVDWVRLSVSAVVPLGAKYMGGSIMALSSSQTYPAGSTMDFAGLFIEPVLSVGDYFDYTFGPDYVSNGTGGNAEAYYYKNRVERYAALRRVLTENVPAGIGVADPAFGPPSF